MQKIGLLAGVGRLPVDFAFCARNLGLSVVAIAVLPTVENDLAEAASVYYQIGVGQLQLLVDTLRKEEVSQVTMLGKVTKELLFSGAVELDGRFQRLLASLPDQKDDTILLALVKELAQEGIQVADQTALLKMLLPQPGVLSKRQPTERELADMDFGLSMAREIGALDIGQTVVVKDRAVMAVEAIEGTDACIRRGGVLAGGTGAVVAKAAKPQQDQRFDMPGAGPATIRSMIEAGASALVLEAGKTLLVDRAEAIALADAHNIAIVVK